MLRLTLLFLICTIWQSAFAETPPWPENFVRLYTLKTERVLKGSISGYTSGFRETAEHLTQLMGTPVSKISPEFVQMTSGDLVIGQPDYSSSFDFPEVGQEVASMLERSATGKLSLDEFQGPRWIHMIKPIDDEEEACLWIVKNDGRYTGCGDPWQDGLRDDEVVCIGKRTYLRCHVDCLKQIYQRESASVPGFCPEGTP